MAIKYDVVASTGTYTDKDGNEKKRWQKCGVVMETKNGGLALKLEAIPVGEWSGWFNLWEPDRQRADEKLKPGKLGMGEEIPF
jgi:hypothetical protein